MDRVAAIKRLLVKLQSMVALRLGKSVTHGTGMAHAFTVIIAMLLGLLGAYGAIGFRLLIQLAHRVSYGTGQYTLDMLRELPWWHCLLMPTAGGLLVGLIVTRLSPEVRGSGVPEVMEAVAKKGGAIHPRVVLTKAVAASLTIGSGGSAGREGPIVHIGSALGSQVGRLFKVPPRQLRTFVACGTAAAVAATFNAPIAGALFAIEVVLQDMRVASMSPIVIASVVATVISRHHLGDFPAFRVPPYQLVGASELLFYAVLGVAAAVVSWVFIKVLYGTNDLFEKVPAPPWIRPALGGLFVGVIALLWPHVFGVGYETINGALWGRVTPAVLGMVLAAKMVATSLTLGSGGSGGIFAPSLFMGACLGNLLGHGVNHLFPDGTADPGAYALVGMGALVSGVTHAPITASLIIFELTNDYRIIPPLMFACVISVLLSSHLGKDSIYTKKLTRRGVSLSRDRDVNLLRSIRVESVMDREPVRVPAGMAIGDLLKLLLGGQRQSAVVVDAQQRCVGIVGLAEIRTVLQDDEDLASLVIAADVADMDIPVVTPRDRLDLVMHFFGLTSQNELPVCDSPKARKILGVVTKRAVIDAYNLRTFQADLSGGMGSAVNAVRDGHRMVEVVSGMHLGEVDLPARFMGKTLKELDLRRELGLEVVLIHREASGNGGSHGVFPSPDFRLEAGDRIVVMGEKAAIQKLAG
jgi:chloride channel protein, CIC family